MKLLEYAIKQFESKNYEEAFKCFNELIVKDDMICEYYLGLSYQNGLGVLKDDDEAFFWFKKSGNKGYANSQYEVGLKYSYMQYSFDDFLALDDDEIENMEAKAFKWYDKASSQCHKKAQIELGICYLHGGGTSINHEKGLKLLLTNIDLIDSHTSYCIAHCYYFEEHNINEAIKWYIKAHEQGDLQASVRLAEIYMEDKKDYVNALYWYEKSFENGNIESMFKIGNIYYYDKYFMININEAIKWYHKAAQNNQFDALKRLGKLYLEGLYVKQDIEKGIKYLITANKNQRGNKYIEIDLEMIYKKGFDLGEYNIKYDTLFKARSGDFNSQIEFGYKYLTVNSPKSYKKELVTWLIKSATEGNKDAQFLLGINCNNENEKYEWLAKAASQNHKKAQYILAERYNNEDAIELYISASEEIFEAKLKLGYIYGHTIIDYYKAYEWYQKAGIQMNEINEDDLNIIRINSWKYGNIKALKLAKEGNVDAQIYLGCLYEYGFEYKQNINKAIYWYNLAANQGVEEAKTKVIKLNNKLV